MGKTSLAFVALGVAVAGALAYACVGNGDSVTCPKYCGDMQKTCTNADMQFPDDPTCERFCVGMDPGEAGVASGDNVACRAISVSNAKDEPDPNTKHADCVGGGIVAAQCTGGDACAAFCKMDLELCGATRTGYADVNDCISACATWGQSFDGPLLGSTGNTLQCRTYHLELSQTGSANDLETHCPHTGKVSVRCNDPDAGASDAAAE